MKPKNLPEMQQKAILLICKVWIFAIKNKCCQRFLCFLVIKDSFLESVFSCILVFALFVIKNG
jgi:hypothetical protein